MNRYRIVLGLAGIVGALGVVSAAASSHLSESRNLGAIAAVCLAHGPALLALALAQRPRGIYSFAALALALGTLVFSADLGIREQLEHGLFPGAAPLGGVGMIGGWLLLVVAAATERSRR